MEYWRKVAVEPQKQIKVNTVDLEPGMYIVRLDRPWTETPDRKSVVVGNSLDLGGGRVI